jgi:dihydrofolate reductase
MAYVTCDVAISADGYSSGPAGTVSIDAPLGAGDTERLHRWMFETADENRAEVEAIVGTTFHFVTGGLDEAFGRAAEVAGDGRIAVSGGASTINQALTAGLIDELRLHIAPFTLGAGERIFDGVPPLKLEQIAGRSASLVTHVTYKVG